MSEDEVKIDAPPVELIEDPCDAPDDCIAPASSVEMFCTPESLIGEIIAGHYEILSILGQGGIGVVYKARHALLGTPAAIKFLLTSNHLDSTAIMRFQREAQATVDLKHPHIAGMKEFGVHKAIPYLVTEFVEGKSIAEVIQTEGSLDPRRALSLLQQMADALSFAHKHKVVHRDIKPANIIVSKAKDGSEEIKIIDFGIAKVLEGDSRNFTQTGEVFGTPKYMSPEQCKGATVDYRCDLYSLGCVAYEMLSGKPPFNAASPLELIFKHVNERHQNLKSIKGFKGINKIIDALLAKDPNHRYQSCEELLTDVGLILDGKEPVGKPAAVDRRRVKKLMIVMMVMCTSVLLFYAWFLSAFQGGTIQSTTQDIAREPGNASHYWNRAKLYEQAERYREAISDFTKAIELNPKFFWAYKNRSEVYSKLNEFDKAAADAEKAIEIWPKQYRGYLARAIAFHHLGRDREALVDVDKSLELNHDNLPLNMWNNRSISYYYRAACHNSLGEYSKALEDVQRAITGKPAQNTIDRSDIYSELLLVERARAFIGLKQYGEAAKDAEAALAIDPSNGDAQRALAEAKKLQGS
jgi:serine/threonine protein kinase